jgi:hypothetical protein
MTTRTRSSKRVVDPKSDSEPEEIDYSCPRPDSCREIIACDILANLSNPGYKRREGTQLCKKPRVWFGDRPLGN